MKATFWTDEDQDYDTRSMRDAHPEGFIWQCCNKRGDEEDCRIRVHRRDAGRQDDGENQYDLGSPNGVQRARMQGLIDHEDLPSSLFNDLLGSAGGAHHSVTFDASLGCACVSGHD